MMNRSKTFLAFDIGASSGRAIAGIFDEEKLILDEVHRFPNEPVMVHDSMYWDMLRLFFEIKKGLSLFVKKYGTSLDGIGVNTWGGDFGLFDKNGNLLGNPYHYRDKRTNGIEQDILGILDSYRIYQTTGRSLAPSDTLCQLYSMSRKNSSILGVSESMLMMPGIINYFLTGEKVEEYTVINTSCLYDIRSNCFATEFLDRLNIPQGIMPRVIESGTIIRPLLPAVAEEVGLGDVPVIAIASHDTASAAVAVPSVDSQGYAFISSGTWSVIGMETSEPVITRQSYQFGMVTEGTAGKKFITVSEIPGMWIINECRKTWKMQGEILGYQKLEMLVKQAKPFSAFIEPNDKTFANPPDMPLAIMEYCKNTGQKVPENKGTIIRTILESLALQYKEALIKIEALKGSLVETLHIVGGGMYNRLLNQFTADATGKVIIAGPSEATAIGNIIMQAIGIGYLKSISEARGIIRSSFQMETYYPEDKESWKDPHKSQVGGNDRTAIRGVNIKHE